MEQLATGMGTDSIMASLGKVLSGEAGRQGELFVAVGSWTVCSVGMLVFNKLAIKSFSPPCTLVAFQLLFTAGVMVSPPVWKTIHIGSFRDALRWSMVVPFFTGMILTSILALSMAPMTLVMTFRALSPCVSLMIERFYPNPLRLSPLMILSLVGCLFGMWLYLYDMDKSHFHGIWWAVLNNFFAVGDRLLQRLMLAKDQAPVDISKTGVTLLNNLLGMVPLLVAALVTNEFPKVQTALQSLDGWGITWIIVSCFVGVGISYTGVWAQGLISATSFLVLINANKFAILFIEVFVMKDKTLGVWQLTGATVSILSAVAYGKAREAVEKVEEPKDKKEELIDLSSHSESSGDEESSGSSKSGE